MYTFTDTLYDRRRRGPARKPVLRLCSSRRLVTFKAAKHAAMQLPCNIVLPPWKRPTSLLLSRVFHGLQTLSPPISRRALSLHSGLSCFPTLNWIECRIRPFGIGPRFSSPDRNWTRREKSFRKDEYIDTLYIDTVGGERWIPPQFRRATEITPGTRCFRVLR